jgi:hypothetical protein
MEDRKSKRTLLWVLFMLLLVIFGLGLCMSKLQSAPATLVCGTNVKGFGTALRVYAFEYNNKYPTENWCDLLVMQADVPPKKFMCFESDCVKGESSYALNLAAAQAGINAPHNMVVVFETSTGRSGERETLPNGRKFQTVLKDMKIGEVYKDRWNQIGGPELLTLDHHNGQGAWFLFADGHSDFVKADDLPELQWNVSNTIRLTQVDVQWLVNHAQQAKAAKKHKWKKR